MIVRQGKKQVVTFRTAIIFAIVLAVSGLAFYEYQNRDTTPDPRLAFAQCIKDSGAKFYGAYWCPHCASQKKLFGKAVKNLNYIECAIPGDSKGLTQPCKDAEIKSFPTWTFADGSKETGEQSFEDLADKTGCTLPETKK